METKDILNSATVFLATNKAAETKVSLIEGKTKIIFEHPDDATRVILQAKDDITANNKEMHDVIKGKSELATQTTSNVFRLLKSCGIPVAFDGQVGPKEFVAPKCKMIPYEVIIRREAHGSYLKRTPHLKKGHIFSQLKLEFFLKTADKVWQGATLLEDDPFLQFDNGKAYLYETKKPFYTAEPFMTLSDYPLKDQPELFEQMGDIARKTFLILEKAWQQVGRTLVDFKVEFGFDTQGNLLLADVIDNDSWRVLEHGAYIDKQAYREGADLNEVTKKYQRVAKFTEQFTIPQQQIILWRGSEKDDLEPFTKALKEYEHAQLHIKTATISIHKQPVHGYIELQKLLQECPNSVIIAYIGKSNGAGPTLSAVTTTPLITVPAGWKNRPENVWSSLDTPSNTPVATILNPSNAVQAAINILAQHSPYLHMKRKTELESRMINIAQD